MTENQYFSKIAIDLIKDYTERGYENAVACIDWLKKISQEDSTCSENQGEKNPCETCEEPRLNCQNFPCEKKKNFDSVNKVKQKFYEGDWILYSGDHYEGVRHITKINENGYYIERNGLPHGIIPFDHEICMRLWTIQDAKPGDVLATDKSVFIYAKVLYNKPYAYCGVDKFGVFKDNCLENDWSNSLYNIHPATKEQCDLLFKMMKENGYEWDAEKKELKKIHVIDEGKAEMDYCFTNMMNGKKVSSAWSEEDEEYNGEDYGIDSLYHAQEILERTLGKVDGYQSDDGILEHKCAITAIKKLYEQKTSKWSEEDEKIILSIEQVMNCASLLNIVPEKIDKIKSWLKSLKQRYTWKPSDEQMKALHDLNLTGNISYAGQGQVLIELYNDLEELIK